MPLVTQNQQSTTYLCHNWNSELTLYAYKQNFYGVWELLIIWLNLGVTPTITGHGPFVVSGHKDNPRIAAYSVCTSLSNKCRLHLLLSEVHTE